MLDTFVLERFSVRIYIPPPSEQERFDFFFKHLRIEAESALTEDEAR